MRLDIEVMKDQIFKEKKRLNNIIEESNALLVIFDFCEENDLDMEWDSIYSKMIDQVPELSELSLDDFIIEIKKALERIQI